MTALAARVGPGSASGPGSGRCHRSPRLRVTVALASLVSYFTIRHQLLSQIDSALVADVSSAPHLSPDGTFNPGEVGRILRSDGGFLQVITPQGAVVDSSVSGSRPMQPTAAQAALASAGHGYVITTVVYQGSSYRVITVGGYSVEAFPGSPLAGVPLAIQIARPLADVAHTLADLRLILWLVTLAGIAVAVGLGYLIGRTTLRPIERLTSAAEHVAATQDLDATIDEQGDDRAGPTGPRLQLDAGGPGHFAPPAGPAHLGRGARVTNPSDQSPHEHRGADEGPRPSSGGSG